MRATTWRLISRADVAMRGERRLGGGGHSRVLRASEVGSSRPLGIVIAPLDGGTYQLVAPLLGWMPDGEVLWALPSAGP